MLTEKISVTDMKCDGCAGRVRMTLLKVQGVVKVITSLDDHTTEVTFDERLTSSEKLKISLQAAGFGTADNASEAGSSGAPKCC